MKHNILYNGIVLLIMASFFLVSCAERDDIPTPPLAADEPVAITLNAGSIVGGSLDSMSIDTLRMIVADQNTGVIFQNLTSFGNTLVQGSTDSTFLLKVKPGKYTISIIANESTEMTSSLNNNTSLGQVESTVIDSTRYKTYLKNDMLLYGKTNIMVDTLLTGNNGTGRVSIDGGVTWNSFFTANLKRAMAKVSLVLKKNTTTASDVVTINQVWLMHLPAHFYLGSAAYTESVYLNRQAGMLSSPITLSTNSTGYTAITLDQLIPENQFSNSMDSTKCSYLLIAAQYNSKVTLYTIPLGSYNNITHVYTDYQVYRNNHYSVQATITQPGTISTQCTISVLPWNSVQGGAGFDSNVTFSGSWAGGTNISQGNVFVYYNQYIEYNFTLNTPAGAIWTASLTNGNAFMFSNSGGAVSQGIAAPGQVYKIRITPRQLQSTPGIKTDFYITVGGQEIDINTLSSSTSRYTIYQIPQ